MSTTTTPNMGLTVPGVGSEPGPNWAQEVNGDFSILDRHNHSTGQGVQITPNGININGDLPFNSNNATLLRTSRFVSQVAPITNASPDVGCIYVSGNELYYNDYTGGNQVKITTNGSVNAGSGSISGLPSGTASASFSAGTFTWQSATSTPATMDMGTIIVRETVASGKGVTIKTVNSLASNYNLVLPSGNAGEVNSFMLSDTSGNMSYAAVDGTTILNGSGTVSAGVMQTANYAANSVTRPKLVAVGQQISSSSGLFSTASATYVSVTNMNVTITTTGRPVVLAILPPGGGSSAFFTSDGAIKIAINNGSSNIAEWALQPAPTGTWILPGSLWFLDVPGASTITYTVKALLTSGTFCNVDNCKLAAYEL